MYFSFHSIHTHICIYIFVYIHLHLYTWTHGHMKRAMVVFDLQWLLASSASCPHFSGNWRGLGLETGSAHIWCLDAVAVCNWRWGPSSITKLWEHVDKKFTPLCIIVLTWQAIFWFMKCWDMKPNTNIQAIKKIPISKLAILKYLHLASKATWRNPFGFDTYQEIVDCRQTGTLKYEAHFKARNLRNVVTHWTCTTYFWTHFSSRFDGSCNMYLHTISRVNRNPKASWATVF